MSQSVNPYVMYLLYSCMSGKQYSLMVNNYLKVDTGTMLTHQLLDVHVA